MMEVMVAVFILTLALTAILSLVTYTVTGQQASEQQIIAQQLAREGIEVARNFRDSDALEGVPSSDSAYRLYTSPIDTMEVQFTPGSSAWSRGSCSGCPWSPPAFPTGYRLWFKNGAYQESSAAAQPTPYARRLELAHICRDAGGVEAIITSGSCAASSPRVGTRVTSRVAYSERAQLREVVLYDYLYEWK